MEIVHATSKAYLIYKPGRKRQISYDITYMWSRKWQPTPAFLPGKSHGRRSLVDYSPWDCKELDTTEQIHFILSGTVLQALNNSSKLEVFITCGAF